MSLTTLGNPLHYRLDQPNPRLVVAVGDSLQPGALRREACCRMIVADELWLHSQFRNVVDELNLLQEVL